MGRLITVLLMLLPLGLLSIVSGNGFIAGSCHDEVFEEVSLGQTGYFAVAYHRDCGATTAKNTQVAIKHRWLFGLFSWSSEVFVVDGVKKARLNWVNDKLRITVFDITEREVFRQENRVKSIDITYNISNPSAPNLR